MNYVELPNFIRVSQEDQRFSVLIFVISDGTISIMEYVLESESTAFLEC